MRDKLILLSGGMDSSTLFVEYVDDIGLAVSFNYGSKHNDIEIKYAANLCAEYGIMHKVIHIDLSDFKSSLLKGGEDVPDGNYDDETMKSTVVPFRNGIMLSMAAGMAESYDCKTILIANHFGDHAIYPDCRANFIEPMNKAIENGTYNNIKIFAPYTDLTKRQIALKGKSMNMRFEKTYSCYKGDMIHCGTCGTCQERKEALQGFDPTKYKK